ncbi:MAG: hypothetical protein P4L36_18075 [Holophaga sp.]|nr:hypothetical protein [Holophaga sp.]
MATPVPPPARFFDGFTRAMLGAMCVLLMALFLSAGYMSRHKMEAAGTDDRVNNLATTAAGHAHHPFSALPGDTQLGAFSIANFFAGIIVGYHWLRLFGRSREGT